MSRVVHFEIPSGDPNKAIEFYRNVFGWQFKQFGTEEYWLANTGADNTPGINGALMKRRDPNQPVTNAIDVEDIDAAMTAVTAHGGQIVVPKSEIPGVGWLCYFKDTDGNIFAIWQQVKR